MGGRVHVMQKVLKILRAEVLLPTLPLTDAQFNLSKGALKVAERETGRIAPLPSVFAEHVRTVVDAVRGAWSKRIATSGCSDAEGRRRRASNSSSNVSTEAPGGKV
jgi:hypothetical protein